MPQLDIMTPKGKKVVDEQHKAVAIFHANFPNLEFRHTSKTEASRVAGRVYIRESGKLKGLVILRCRSNTTVESFKTRWHNELIVTSKKIDVATGMCKREAAALMVFAYFTHEKVLAVRTAYDPSRPDPWLEPKVKSPERRETQATVNGGRDKKPNSMVPMHKAKWVTMPK